MHKRQYSMKWKVIRILLLCWLVPFLFLIGGMGVYIGSHHSDMTAANYHDQLEFNLRNCVERLNKAVADSRQASYEGKILETKRELLSGKIFFEKALQEYRDYLSARYQRNQGVSAAILWFEDGEELRSASTYNEKGNGSYTLIQNYWKNDHDQISQYAEQLDTSVGFHVSGQNLYLVRNLVDNHFRTQAVLVLILNQNYCFESIFSYPMQETSAIWINEESTLSSDPADKEYWNEQKEKYLEKPFYWDKESLYLSDTEKGDSYQLLTVMKMKDSVTMFPFMGYQYVIVGMLISLVIMLILVLRVFRKQVTEPVTQLLDGVSQIDQGELGYQIQGRTDSQEFDFLVDAVNRMSNHLKIQFNQIYEEEIALREARIMALQSHINPHFMNNTLEIINWEARLGGNEKVSNMIGALSELLDAALDRRKRPEVTLQEEMTYVNAYLYIMKERLGERLVVVDELDENLMNCQVPRLILQPVIENAIEHGILQNGSGSGTIFLRGSHEDRYLYLDIVNDGGLSTSDKEKIEKLLQPNYNTSKEKSSNLGIANVNQRLRILFGEPCGLKIAENDQCVTARLVVPWNTDGIK